MTPTQLLVQQAALIFLTHFHITRPRDALAIACAKLQESDNPLVPQLGKDEG